MKHKSNKSLYEKLLLILNSMSTNIRNCSSFACESLIQHRGVLSDPIQVKRSLEKKIKKVPARYKGNRKDYKAKI